MMTTEKTAVISVGRIYCDLIFTGLNELPVLGRELFARDMEIAPAAEPSLPPPISPMSDARLLCSQGSAPIRFRAISVRKWREAAWICGFWNMQPTPDRR